jgi:hypothetical protein
VSTYRPAWLLVSPRPRRSRRRLAIALLAAWRRIWPIKKANGTDTDGAATLLGFCRYFSGILTRMWVDFRIGKRGYTMLADLQEMDSQNAASSERPQTLPRSAPKAVDYPRRIAFRPHRSERRRAWRG